MKPVLVAAVVLTLAGCTETAVYSAQEVSSRLQKLTATAVRAPDPSAITIENTQRFPAKWQWRATVSGKSFSCDSDEQFRLPSCSET